MILELILIVSIVFLLIILSMVWPPDSPWSPWWRTSKKAARAMCELAKVTNKDIVYDLGSGDGTSLIVAAREFGTTGVGIEIDPLRSLISKILVRLNGVSKKIKIKRKNFFDENLSSASVIFVYLVPKTLNRLKPKLLKELKPGTRLISYRYEIDLPLVEYDKENAIRLYKIPKILAAREVS